MFITLGQAKTSRLKEVAAACPNSSEFVSLVNEATERLMNRGDWDGTVVPIFVCSFAGCVVFPRFVGQVRKLNVCRHPVDIQNHWFDFFEDTERHRWLSWCGDGCMSVPTGYSPVFQDIMGDGRQLRFFPQVQADKGKIIQVFGEDNSGIRLRTNNGNGTWSDGVNYRLDVPYGTLNRFVRRVERLILPGDLQGNVYAFAYNVADNVLETLATYFPGDVNPSFVRHSLRIPRCPSTGTGTCGNSKPLVALVKLKFIPAVVDSDLVLIENISALKLMIQCIKAEEAGDEMKARLKEKAAIRELNLELRDAMPEDQTPIDFGALGGTNVGMQSCF